MFVLVSARVPNVIIYRPFAHSHSIIELYVFIPFSKELFPLYNGTRSGNSNGTRSGNSNGTRSGNSNGKGQFELYFLIICRYLNLVENQRMIS